MYQLKGLKPTTLRFTDVTATIITNWILVNGDKHPKVELKGLPTYHKFVITHKINGIRVSYVIKDAVWH